MSIFSRRLKYVNTRVWDATRPDFKYPEVGDPQLADPNLTSRPNVGIAFSGGGTRSAACTIGQLRGLSELGLLPGVRYVSAVSGGAWAATPFTYLPTSWSDQTFMGRHALPAQITLEALKTTDRNAFVHAIANSVIVDEFFANAFRLAGDEAFSRTIGQVFLDAFGMDSTNKFFTWNEKSRAAILAGNRRMHADDFHVARAGRPFLLLGATCSRPENPPGKQMLHFEITPLYKGCRVLHPKAGSGNRPIGGGYVEPFGCDSDEPDDPMKKGRYHVRLGGSRHRFTLSDAVGTTGAAPAHKLERLGVGFFGFPEFNHWTPTDPRGVSSKEYTFSDGGLLENLGVMPLLMRGVERIVVFVNTQHGLNPRTPDSINGSIPPLFGMTPGFKTNHVFPSAKYPALLNGLRTARDNEGPVFHRDRYRVLRNRHYGIPAGGHVEVLWVYNERVPDWERQLQPAVAGHIGHGSLGNFPHYKTFFQNPPKVIDLSATQAQLLAHLSSWNVLELESEMRAMLA